MRTAIALLVLFCVGRPALAHDDTFGLRHCYSGKHCPQDTLVFGVVTEVKGKAYTVVVRKVLRTKGDVIAGMRVHLVNPYPKLNATFYRQPKVNGGVLVSFLKKGPGPYRHHYLIRSTTTDWRAMSVDVGDSGYRFADIEDLVRSGGTAFAFFGVGGRTYIVTPEGRMEPTEIEAGHIERNRLLPDPPPRARAKGQQEESRVSAARPAPAQGARRPGATAAPAKGARQTAPAASR